MRDTFEIYGDEIVFDGWTVGRLGAMPSSVLERVCEALRSVQSASERERERTEALEAEYEAGYAEGQRYAEAEIEDLRSHRDQLEFERDGA